jgi:acetolactate synthase-1/3 small subunit
MKRTLIALIEDTPAALNRVASTLRRRNFNIESVTLGQSELEGVARMTLVVDGALTPIDQVVRQLYRVTDLMEIRDVTEDPIVILELALVKVKANATTRPDIMQLVDVYRAKIVDVALNSLVIEITGPEDKVDSFIGFLEEFGIMEIVRTGRVVMVRGRNEQG